MQVGLRRFGFGFWVCVKAMLISAVASVASAAGSSLPKQPDSVLLLQAMKAHPSGPLTSADLAKVLDIGHFEAFTKVFGWEPWSVAEWEKLSRLFEGTIQGPNKYPPLPPNNNLRAFREGYQGGKTHAQFGRIVEAEVLKRFGITIRVTPAKVRSWETGTAQPSPEELVVLNEEIAWAPGLLYPVSGGSGEGPGPRGRPGFLRLPWSGSSNMQMLSGKSGYLARGGSLDVPPWERDYGPIRVGARPSWLQRILVRAFGKLRFWR